MGTFKNKNNIKGITLISLIITIVIMLILAGVSINLILGDNGLIKKVQQAKNASEAAQVEENKALADGEAAIDDVFDSNVTDEEYNNALLLDGSTYINSNLSEDKILENNEYTIKARVCINEDVQKSIDSMCILGNYQTDGNLLWQFDDKTSMLKFVSDSIKVDYTPYYDQWTDIVTTYKDGIETVYINGTKVKEGAISVSAYSNLLIGTGDLSADRALRGAISSVKVWNKVVNLSKVNTTSTLNLIFNAKFDDVNTINSIGSIVGTKYQIINVDEKTFNYSFRFNHSAYLNTDLQESTILQNGKYTIAARVKINRADQSYINYMDILGNHSGNGNIIWQFDVATTNIYFCHTDLKVDYTPYYDKWVDIVTVYENNYEKVYFNKTLVLQASVTMTPYENLMIGTGYTYSNRALNGYMDFVKIWNSALTVDQVNTLDMTQSNSTIQTSNLIKEININSREDRVNNGLTDCTTSNYVLNIVDR